MADRSPPSDEQAFSEERASLWRITLGPLIWAIHFVLSYSGTAVLCAKIPEAAERIHLLTIGVVVAAAVALAAIAWAGWQSFHQWRDANDTPVLEEDSDGSDEDRHQFLGHAALLLSVISFIGVIYTTLPALLSASCR